MDMDIDLDCIEKGGRGHIRTNEYIGLYPIKEAIKKQTIKIATKKIVAIFKWFWNEIDEEQITIINKENR